MDLHVTWIVFFKNLNEPPRLKMISNQRARHLANTLPGHRHGNDGIAISNFMSSGGSDACEFSVPIQNAPTRPLPTSVVDDATVVLQLLQRFRAAVLSEIFG
jgi:hypothetical protein